MERFMFRSVEEAWRADLDTAMYPQWRRGPFGAADAAHPIAIASWDGAQLDMRRRRLAAWDRAAGDGTRWGPDSGPHRVMRGRPGGRTAHNPLESECFVIRQSVREEPRTSYPGTQR